jgi:hypothetical protein
MTALDTRLRRLAAAALAVGLAVSLTACGGSEKASDRPTASGTPTPSVAVPAGVTITEPGAMLAFGQSAAVAYQPNQARSSVLELKVTKVVRARLADFAQYVLDERTKASTPYYVHLSVANVGTGDVGGTDIPLWAVSQADTLIHSSGFTNSFKPCPSPSLPKTFGAGAKLDTCLVYLVPDHGTLTSVSFRPLQSVAGIEWKGTIEVQKAPVKHGKSGKPHKGGKKK